MDKIYLVRHGQDTDNAADILNGRRDTDLTDTGVEQARRVAEKLAGHSIRAVYSSPLKRAHHTARIIAAALGIPSVITDDGLIERDFGVLTGKPRSDVLKLATNVLPTDRVTYFLEAEGAENFSELLKRGAAILEKITKEHPAGNVLIVTHGDIGKMIRAAFHGWDWKRGLETPYFDNTEVLELSAKNDIVE